MAALFWTMWRLENSVGINQIITMPSASKHFPFDSIYRPDFEVVEERHGKVSLFPHTEQLPKLLRALNLEFYGALPHHIARTDKRGDGFHKILIKDAALFFCTAVNAGRTDSVRLVALPDADLVHRVTVVQQVTEETSRGKVHRFRFYGGENFSPEIFMCGRRVAFADHVLERFSSRVPNRVGEDLSIFLVLFFGSPHIALPVGPGNAFVVALEDSVLAFPFKESDDGEFFITTCLTINEINSIEEKIPPAPMNFSYSRAFEPPRVRHWSPTKWMVKLVERWKRKVPMPPSLLGPEKLDWHKVAQRVKDSAVRHGHGPGSQLFFLDHIVGPCYRDVKPGGAEPRMNELEEYKKLEPGRDWEKDFARCEAMLRYKDDSK